MQQVAGIVPLLSNMSLGIVMRFPGAEGEETPLVSDEEVDAQAIIAEATRNAPAALQAVLPENLQGMAGLLGGLLAGLPPLTITFDANGVGTLTGLAPFIASQIPQGAIALPADTLAQLQDLGIQSLNITNSADGLNITVNGNELPMLVWNRGEMRNLADLGIESGALQVLGNLDEGTVGTLETVANAAPILQAAKLDVTINLP
jgi:hypothetical protein